ncbi:hypothetical protein DKX38_007666 [Salix brachista]|uniref:RING-type domain-containing protein n=1 Tax=Salix brachista TaxID=2182728 RepID=A0A5N5MP32_9ROSI|nr:hypothetical protein DKX38_007666 [Salix brachista]
MGLRGHPRIKDAATACKRITLDESGNVKQGVLESPVGSSSSEIVEAEGEYCCVCLSRLKADEDTSALPCSHQFHKLVFEFQVSAHFDTLQLKKKKKTPLLGSYPGLLGWVKARQLATGRRRSCFMLMAAT